MTRASARAPPQGRRTRWLVVLLLSQRQRVALAYMQMPMSNSFQVTAVQVPEAQSDCCVQT
jgi:hypothetical protein